MQFVDFRDGQMPRGKIMATKHSQTTGDFKNRKRRSKHPRPRNVGGVTASTLSHRNRRAKARQLSYLWVMSVATIALSGMNAANASMDSAAHNIANLATRDFRRQSIVPPTTKDAGDSSSPMLAARAVSSPVEDMVGLLQSKNAFLANLSVFKTADAMTGSLLDITR